MLKYALAALAVTVSIGSVQAATTITLAENAPIPNLSDGKATTDNYFYLGQSFTVNGTAGTSYNNIAFSFLAGRSNSSTALGKLYLFASEYKGDVSGLSSATGAIASVTATSNAFNFASTTALVSGLTYYAYSDAVYPQFNDSYYYGGGTYPGGQGYTYDGRSFAADGAGGDINFRVTGTAVVPVVPPVVTPPVAAVPEPATWAMMIAGFGLVGFAMRRRGQQNVAVRFA